MKKRGGTGKFCSVDCYQASRKAATVQLVLVNERPLAKARKAPRSRIHWSEIVERDAHSCHLCGGQVRTTGGHGRRYDPWGPTVDHLIPLSVGGEDVLENVRLAHHICNAARGAAPIDALAGG